MGETSEAPGFKPKPAEPQRVGISQDEEFWNTYQGLQEQLSRNTHKGSQPICERGKEHCDNSGSCNKTQNTVSTFWVPSSVHLQTTLPIITLHKWL